ncbi:hypothetical protein [Microbacterium allomyrinae]|uniref:DNA primase n=1 Tax=Microbacterium allomyrinae TaxID=2830666 RepID=A0A9X1LTL7_9MICO|nr:hypothetical protein [Microbacterium allomyrinae]MCC2031819.1 hypothetical protein [Microbacterium allomyrinae]
MRECESCGRSITNRNAQARYCSTRCRVAGHRAAKRQQLPLELTRRDRWVRWTPSKRPITVTGEPASSTDPTTWGSYQAARDSTVGAGLGFALGDGLGCIDIDHCLVDGELTAAAAAFLAAYAGHYIEISPSGTGLHIWGHRAEQPGRRYTVAGLPIEVYSTGRYMTVTGSVFQYGSLAPIEL